MSYEPISVFDIFKIGIGPSSSHTLGPWRAALQFIHSIRQKGLLDQLTSIRVLLYGSLAKTGKGHGTDIAVQLGLMGEDPVTYEVAFIEQQIASIATHQVLCVGKTRHIVFDPGRDIEFWMTESLPFHPNALTFLAAFDTGATIAETYYSVGGGFVVQEHTGSLQSDASAAQTKIDSQRLPFPIDTAHDLLHWCMKTGMTVSEIVLENEGAWRDEQATRDGLLRIWSEMKQCIYKGCHTEGYLPGGLQVKRRAAGLNQRLLQGRTYSDFASWLTAIQQGGDHFKYTLDWVSCFALAVNEENASFGRVVTAPTNGAAGVIPAVLLYYLAFCDNNEEQIIRFLLTASEIGSIFKKGSTISAAMGGCQAEIGVSSAMAAAALTECMGGTQRQVLMASEIAMEHHLGLTCDPIGGLVQIPCIERNTMGAIKAITASQLALQSSPDFAKVSLDAVVKTMWETAVDMSHKYKETAEGGLAVHIPLALSEC